MEGVIINFRRGRHTQTPNQMVIRVPNTASSEDAEKLVGKKVTWKSPAGKELKGEVKSAHGSTGAVRVLFDTGMPGQSIGSKVVLS